MTSPPFFAARLPDIELLAYLVTWMTMMGYALIRLFNFCRYLENNASPLWRGEVLINATLPGFDYREKLDLEYTIVEDAGLRYVACSIVHVVFRRLIIDCSFVQSRRNLRQLLLILSGAYLFSHCIASLGFLLFCGLVLLVDWILITRIYPAYFPRIANQLGPNGLALVVALVQLFWLFTSYFNYVELLFISPSPGYNLASKWIHCWNQLRLVSFFAGDPRCGGRHYGFMDLATYCYYFPTIAGPFQPFKRFLDSNDLRLDAASMPEDQRRQIAPRYHGFGLIKKFISNTFIVVGWWLFTEFAKHSFMPTVLALSVDAYELMGYPERAAHAWIFGQLFQAKYMQLYGGPWLVALLDTGMELTPLPSFITLIYRFSDMWRKFDTGMYEFMRSNVFIPASNILNRLGYSALQTRLLAIVLTYAFVFVFHGATNVNIFIFAGLNLLVLCSEIVLSIISEAFEWPQKLSGVTRRRLGGLVATIGVEISWSAFAFLPFHYTLAWNIVNGLTFKTLPTFWSFVIASIGVYSWVQFAMEIDRRRWLKPRSKSD